MIKKITIFLGIISLILIVFLATRYWYTASSVTTTEQSQVLLEKIKTVTKLITVEGQFSEIYDHKDYWKYDISPFRKQALVRIKGTVSVGYNLEQMDIKVLPEQKIILISNLPDPVILSIDHDLDYYDITEGTFNSFTPEDYNRINQKAKELIREKAVSSDLFLAAEAQGNQMLDIIKFMAESMGWTVDYTARKEPLLNPAPTFE